MQNRHIARLNVDGSFDTDFGRGIGASGSVLAFVLKPDGKVLIGGGFTSYDGKLRGGIARLNVDGSLDTSFDPGTGADGSVHTLALQSDGKMLIGGSFTSYDGVSRNRIARLNTDGSLDTSFDPGSGANNHYVQSLALQPDGKVLVGGWFTSYNATPRNRIARLNVDGSLDTSFDPGTGANDWVQSLALQSDGKVLVGGNFTSYNGTGRNCIARLNADGSLDTFFDPGTGVNSGVFSLALQSDGKVLVGSSFTSYNGVSCNSIARLNVDGSLDSTFDPGSGANGDVYSLALQADGRLLVGGIFTSYDGLPRNYLARTHNDPASQSLTATGIDRVEWLRGGSAPEVAQVVFERSGDGVVWTPLGTATRVPGGWELTGLNLRGEGHLRARGRVTGGQYNGSSSFIEQTIPYSLLPEITIRGNGTDIANGDDTPDSANHTAFGDAPVPGEPVVRTFTIANTGEADLELTGDPLVELDGSPAFSLISPPASATLAPGGTQSFQIAFAPSTSGPHFATVRIASDGGDGSPFTFAIGGTGVLADTAVTFAGGLAVIGRTILPGELHRFQLSLDGPRMLSVVTTGGAALCADLRDGSGHLVASFGNGGDLDFRGALLAGSYVLEIHRQPGEDPAQDYELTLDTSTVASVRPEVVVGTTPTSLTGKLATVVSKKVRPLKAHARVANRGNLPDALAVRAGKGNALCREGECPLQGGLARTGQRDGGADGGALPHRHSRRGSGLVDPSDGEAEQEEADEEEGQAPSDSEEDAEPAGLGVVGLRSGVEGCGDDPGEDEIGVRSWKLGVRSGATGGGLFKSPPLDGGQ